MNKVPKQMRESWERNNPGVPVLEALRLARYCVRVYQSAMTALFVGLIVSFWTFYNANEIFFILAFYMCTLPLAVIFLVLGMEVPQEPYEARIEKFLKDLQQLGETLVSLIAEGCDRERAIALAVTSQAATAVTVLDAESAVKAVADCLLRCEKGGTIDALGAACTQYQSLKKEHRSLCSAALQFGLTDGSEGPSFAVAEKLIASRPPMQ
ncbi:MAG: hypothetical protein Q7S01_04640 [bacterium]|nr:hypothetical protein [bacterium]